MNQLKLDDALEDSNFFLGDPNVIVFSIFYTLNYLFYFNWLQLLKNQESNIHTLDNLPEIKNQRNHPCYYQSQTSNKITSEFTNKFINLPSTSSEDNINVSNHLSSKSFQKMKPQNANLTSINSKTNEIKKSSRIIFQALNNITNKYKQSENIIGELKSSLIELESLNSNSLDLFVINLFEILQPKSTNHSTILSQYGIINFSGFSNK